MVFCIFKGGKYVKWIIRWISEKMDGVRAYWDGHKLYSRQGKEFPAPPHFVEGLPKVPLDGELWMGRGSYDNLMSTLKSKNGEWDLVKYFIFDLPSSQDTFASRYQ